MTKTSIDAVCILEGAWGVSGLTVGDTSAPCTPKMAGEEEFSEEGEFEEEADDDESGTHVLVNLLEAGILTHNEETTRALMRRHITVKPIFAGNQEGAMTQLKTGRVVAAGVNIPQDLSNPVGPR